MIGKGLRVLFVFIVIVFGLWFLHRPILESKHLYIHGDLGDARYTNLLLEHSYQFFFSDYPQTFWTVPWMFYPAKKTLAYSVTMLGGAPFYYIFRVLGINYLNSFQLWIPVMSIMNFIACFWLLKKLQCNIIPCTAGAFVYAFSMPVGSLLNHPQLSIRFYIPISLCLLYLYFTSRHITLRGFFLFQGFCLLFALQFWSSPYSAFFYGLSLAISSLSLLGRPGILQEFFRRLWKDKISITIGFLLFLILIIPLALNYSSHSGLRKWSEVLMYIPSHSSIFYPHPGSYVYKYLIDLPELLQVRMNSFQQFSGLYTHSYTIYDSFSSINKIRTYSFKKPRS